MVIERPLSCFLSVAFFYWPIIIGFSDQSVEIILLLLLCMSNHSWYRLNIQSWSYPWHLGTGLWDNEISTIFCGSRSGWSWCGDRKAMFATCWWEKGTFVRDLDAKRQSENLRFASWLGWNMFAKSSKLFVGLFTGKLVCTWAVQGLASRFLPKSKSQG